MTRETHLKFIQKADLSKADIIYCNYDIRNEFMNLKAYYFKDLDGYNGYIITLNDQSVAGIMIMGIIDIQIDVITRYQRRHIISGFFKYVDWKRNLPEDFEGEVSIYPGAIKSYDDLFMKIHLVNDIMKLRISNLNELFHIVESGKLRNEVE